MRSESNLRFSPNLLWDHLFFPSELKQEFCREHASAYADFFRFFGVTGDKACIGFEISLSHVKFWTRANHHGSSEEPLAEAELLGNHKRRYHELVTVTSLPANRDVLTKVPDYIHALRGPDVTEVLQEFTLIINGVERSMFIQRDPIRFQLGGVMDGKILPDLIPHMSEWKL